MSNKVGRPKVSKQTAKAVLIGARFSGKESEEIERQAKETGQSKSTLLRSRALASRDVWSSRWKAIDLDRETVEFWLLLDGSQYLHAHGQFLAKQRGDGSMSLSIEFHPKPNRTPSKI